MLSIWTITSLAAGIYLSLGAFMYLVQRRLIYFPDNRRVTPAEAGLTDVEELKLQTADCEQVIAWYGRAALGQPSLLYFHGNAGSVPTRSERVRKYMAAGRGILMLDYRGFGGSTGQPSEASNVADAKLAYEALLKRGVAARDIIIYGESLGTGVAVQVAAEKPAAGLILDAPYTRLVDVAAHRYPWLPVSLLMRDRYESNRYLPALTLPLLVVHGALDSTVPVAMGRKVYELAGSTQKDIAIIEGAGHTDHNLFGSYEIINAWIDRLRR